MVPLGHPISFLKFRWRSRNTTQIENTTQYTLNGTGKDNIKSTTEIKKGAIRDSPVVKTSPSSAGVVGSSPWSGAKNTPASQLKNQNINKHCSKFNKDFKNGPLKKRFLKKRKGAIR